MKLLPQKFSLGLGLMLLMIFLLLNPILISPNVEMVRQILIVYLLMLAFTIAALDLQIPFLKTGLNELAYFFVGALVTIIIFSAVPFLSGLVSSFEVIKPVLTGIGIFFGLIFVAIKALCEEMLFRGMLMPRVGLVVQAGLFGAFHFSVLMMAGLSWYMIFAGVVILTMLGLLWGFVTQRMGLMTAAGSHFGYNLFAVGLSGVLIPM